MNSQTSIELARPQSRIPEITLTGFSPAVLFSDWDPSLLKHHPDWVGENFVLSVHSSRANHIQPVFR